MPELYLRLVLDFIRIFGKHVVQPRRDIFERATGLSVSHSTSFGFLTKAKSVSAMVTATEHDLIGTHIDIIRPNTSFGRSRGASKINHKGARNLAGPSGSQLW